MPSPAEILSSNSSSGQSRLAGLDVLRVFALVLVTWQHAASVLGFYAETQWRGISPGQSGVAIFCAISGYLAFRTQPNNVWVWFKKRLFSVFPAYWVVTIAAFAMVMVAGSEKDITLGLFVSQMLGLGFFTHGWELVNVVSWFLSLILLCYVLAAIAWSISCPAQFWLVVFGLALLLVITRTEVDLSRHIMSFALGACFGLQISRALLVTMAGSLLACGIWLDPQIFYSGLGLSVLCLSLVLNRRESKSMATLAKYSYEYFLVHGICLVVAHKLFANMGLTVVVAILAAGLAAVILQRFMHFLAALLFGFSISNRTHIY